MRRTATQSTYGALGCTVFELATGRVLFPGANNNDMLALFAQLKDRRFPRTLLRRGSETDRHFTQELDGSFRFRYQPARPPRPGLPTQLRRTAFHAGRSSAAYSGGVGMLARLTLHRVHPPWHSRSNALVPSMGPPRTVRDLANFLDQIVVINPGRRMDPQQAPRSSIYCGNKVE